MPNKGNKSRGRRGDDDQDDGGGRKGKKKEEELPATGQGERPQRLNRAFAVDGRMLFVGLTITSVMFCVIASINVDQDSPTLDRVDARTSREIGRRVNDRTFTEYAHQIVLASRLYNEEIGNISERNELSIERDRVLDDQIMEMKSESDLKALLEERLALRNANVADKARVADIRREYSWYVSTTSTTLLSLFADFIGVVREWLSREGLLAKKYELEIVEKIKNAIEMREGQVAPSLLDDAYSYFFNEFPGLRPRPRHCSYCNELFVSSRHTCPCGNRRYCGKPCHLGNWSEHKHSCSTYRARHPVESQLETAEEEPVNATDEQAAMQPLDEHVEGQPMQQGDELNDFVPVTERWGGADPVNFGPLFGHRGSTEYIADDDVFEDPVRGDELKVPSIFGAVASKVPNTLAYPSNLPDLRHQSEGGDGPASRDIPVAVAVNDSIAVNNTAIVNNIPPVVRRGGAFGPPRARPTPAIPEPARPEPARPEPAIPEPARPEPARPEPARPTAGPASRTRSTARSAGRAADRAVDHSYTVGHEFINIESCMLKSPTGYVEVQGGNGRRFTATHEVNPKYLNRVPKNFSANMRHLMASLATFIEAIDITNISRDVLFSLHSLYCYLLQESDKRAVRKDICLKELRKLLETVKNGSLAFRRLGTMNVSPRDMGEWIRNRASVNLNGPRYSVRKVFVEATSDGQFNPSTFQRIEGPTHLSYEARYEMDRTLNTLHFDRMANLDRAVARTVIALATLISRTPLNMVNAGFIKRATELYLNLANRAAELYNGTSNMVRVFLELRRIITTIPHGMAVWKLMQDVFLIPGHLLTLYAWIQDMIDREPGDARNSTAAGGNAEGNANPGGSGNPGNSGGNSTNCPPDPGLQG